MTQHFHIRSGQSTPARGAARLLAVAFVFLACALYALDTAGSAAQTAANDPFNGTWRLNTAKSTSAWQAHPQPKRTEAVPIDRATIIIKVAGGTMDCQTEHGSSKAHYAAPFNDAKWQNVHGTPEGPFAAVTLVKINDRLHYWVTRAADGNFTGLLLRRLSDDGTSLTAVGIGPDGYVQYVRVFDKQ